MAWKFPCGLPGRLERAAANDDDAPVCLVTPGDARHLWMIRPTSSYSILLRLPGRKHTPWHLGARQCVRICECLGACQGHPPCDAGQCGQCGRCGQCFQTFQSFQSFHGSVIRLRRSIVPRIRLASRHPLPVKRGGITPHSLQLAPSTNLPRLPLQPMILLWLVHRSTPYSTFNRCATRTSSVRM